ncbi:MULTISPECIES: tetratricopeptide repeat-containing sulfotransferase family protein [Acidithiobacillus]|jgi:tetratricopeptide (TPR) repeat protein|uniref:TPR domain/sulfotransferase domain protein n=2 Tax=Acidithiobacillus ferrooxidans TaxID=920 RepID=B7J8E8_ACIF2|nr:MULTISPECIES: tetratricopeptide repeat-containing sulfotransferase family protein [Acidithiobacillus]ACH84539.1 sulfotransferase [Acidithiobacillus ferrooxidans ATCC 53993]ACK79004.1 TPR domain/sulfotransferase domain protein [Acidithiobacillus ferrooxidans ATCC 23270]MBN6744378.1 tetratricopeptide repeat protein [Acidithiobacillus sp. MC2.2]MBN6747332.1 tetratricopeptide repeat protein [Acidithiobacillus sp. PG05]MBU2773733.1 tetratricopeptide repeat protein [Acidithiobacillus ferrooxidans
MFKKRDPSGKDAAHVALEAIKSHYSQQKYGDAITLIEQATAIPAAEKINLLTTIGQATAGSARLDLAERAFRAALAVDGHHTDTLSNLALILFHQNKLVAAEELYLAAIASKPDFVPAWYNYGLLLLACQRFPEAERAFREALARSPECLDCLVQLGVTLAQQGRQEDARVLLDKALDTDPNHAVALHHRNMLALATGDHCGAEALFRRRMHLYGENPSLLIGLGIALQEQGRLTEAEEIFRRTADTYSVHADVGHYIFQNLVAQQREREAEAYIRSAIADHPQSHSLRYPLGTLLFQQGRYPETLEVLLHTLNLKPDHVDALILSGRALFQLKYVDEAVETFHRALELLPESADAQFHLSVALIHMGECRTAEGMIRKLLENQPDNAAALVNLAICLEKLGEVEAAETTLRKAGNLAPTDLRVRVALAEILQRQKNYAESFALIEPLLSWESGGEGENYAVNAWFIAGNHHHSHRQYAKAFACYRQGHQMLQKVEPFDFQAMADTLRNDLDRYDRWKGRMAVATPNGPTPLFIVGMPRSGTSLLHQMLDMHADIDGLGELRHLPQAAAKLRSLRLDSENLTDHIGAIRQWYLDRIRHRWTGSRYFIDKLPTNFLFLGSAKLLFPEAKVIYCRRDARDNCLSIFQQNMVGDHAYSHDLDSLGKYYRAHLKTLAQWQSRMAEDVITVGYEDIVADPENGIREILQFLKLEYDPRCLDFTENTRMLQTASRLQVKEPIYRSAIGKWEAYTGHLAPLLTALGQGD